MRSNQLSLRRPACLGRPVAAIALACLAMAGPTSGAKARPATTAMTCAAAAALVARSGGIVLDTSATTFDRYVSDRRFCMPDEATRPAFEPTRDNPQCFIGYTCFEPERDRWRW